MNHLISFLVALGILIALFGIAVDYLLPGASPGVDLPQLLVIAAGLALLAVAALLKSARFQRAVPGRLGRSLAAALVVALATIIALEFVLAARGMPTHYRNTSVDTSITLLPWWACGAAGCHYVYEAAQRACESGELRGRVCRINRQGYYDSQDFELPPDWQTKSRVLLLGDSFTWGMAADIGRSFAEILTSELPRAIIWNTGIPGTGTNQALSTFGEYAPVLRPQLTVLGFVPNDFSDNLLPVDSWVNALDAKGEGFHVRKYAIDQDENVIEFDLDTLGYMRAHGKEPPSSELERLLGSTQLGTLLLRVRDMTAASQPESQTYARRRQVTQQYLLELKRAVSASGSELLVIMIPYWEDIEDVAGLRPRFRIAKELMRELEIPYLNPISVLDPTVDYVLPLDGHWTNSGHQKVGELLSDCVRRFYASGGFADCDHIVLPE